MEYKRQKPKTPKRRPTLLLNNIRSNGILQLQLLKHTFHLICSPKFNNTCMKPRFLTFNSLNCILPKPVAPISDTLTIAPSTVLKRIPSSALSDELQGLYELIWLQRPKNIINLAKEPKYGRRTTSLYLCPVGFHPRLRNISELRHAVQGILKGLNWLHQYDYVHRDVRWANIIQDMEGSVRLIDLKYAGKEGVVDGDDVLLHWPTMEGGMYSKGIDVCSVAKMMREYRSLLGGENGREVYMFMTRLERGISAEDALRDRWFLD